MLQLNDTPYWQVYNLPYSILIVLVLVFSVAWSTIKKKIKKNYSRAWLLLNIVLLCLAIMLILGVTILLREPSVLNDRVQIIPFQSLILGFSQPDLYKSVFLNMYLYYPFGLFSTETLIIRNNTLDKKRCLIAVCFSAVMLSAFSEMVQWKYLLGNMEIDDVIFNTLGAMIGSIWVQCGRGYLE